ncbi:class I SAM-dependent methyltransferase [Geobacter sp. FeAm09]|uniref:class I SAM-dependent methyltransferase n=1 Tax=Geobacter sp. FeAm09 TaxID=2597769 RepID=UPI0011EDC809|nr:class I SAM-dependent methyltransferase [Geobacter sp. FeAm09]QEM68966.1 class I SAM-dependent methyltransferase [Geobacter sp. FeAm09]
MNGHTIDWNHAWKQAKGELARIDNREFWNKRAPSFSSHVRETDYEKHFLRMMPVDPSWSVLDVGCAAGTLAIPLAKSVRSVTALDLSPVMIDLLRQRCTESAITNITPLVGRWEDDWDSLGIGEYDVAIASRSLVMDDLAEGIAKLNRAARRMVCISALVGDGPFDRRLYDAVGRPLKMGPDYIYVYNYLYQMGIYADVGFIGTTEWKNYESPAEALEKMLWMLDGITPEEERRLKEYLDAQLVRHDGGWRLPEPKVVRWAFIRWEKEA